jgi:dienelactone hydrolase
VSFLWYWPGGGWDFDRWKRQHAWQPVRSEQSGQDLLPLIAPGAARADWEKSAAHWRKISDEILGKQADPLPPRGPGSFEFLGEEFENRGQQPYLMRRVRYRLAPDEWGYAWLTTPRDAKAPRPCVIALHQTTVAGKDEAMALDVTPDAKYTTYADELAARGFVVLAPDAIAFGERAAEHRNAKYRSADQFFAAHADGSVMGKMNWDVSRAIDLLEQLPQADARRIGCIGHSHGAYGTLFGMLNEPRLKAGVISCGIDLLRDDPGPDRWWRKTALMPRLGFYEGKMQETPIDFHQWLALLAPRPIYVVVAMKDSIFPNTTRLPEVLKNVQSVYDLYGAAGAVKSHIFDGAHQFPEQAREQSYEMLKTVLA